MDAFAPYLAAIHLQNLLEEAALERRARTARKGQSSVPAWRRGLGSVFASAARSLDPSVDAESPAHPSTKPNRARATAS
jgi:hypothetical protein